MRKHVVRCLLGLCLLLALSPPVSAGFSDTGGHWAGKQVEAWAERGIVRGYGGQFVPDACITRGDIATILNRLMRYGDAQENPFSDVPNEAYYAQAVRNLSHAGVMRGAGKEALPGSPAARQEAIVLLARAFRVSPEGSPLTFPDAADVSAWALDAVTAFAERGYLHGDEEHRLRPLDPISRAEFVTILERMIAELVPGDPALAGKGGMILVNRPEAALKNREVGSVLIAPGVGDGSVVLENMTVDRLYVLGGGEHSIIIRGKSRVKSVQIAKQDSGVRVFVSGGAEVETVRVEDGCDDVILSGPIGTVAVDSAANAVRLADAKVGNLTITGKGAEVSVDKDSVVGRLSVAGSASDASVKNAGQIGTVAVDNPSARVARVDTGEGSSDSGGSSGGGGVPVDPSIPAPPAPVQTIFGLTIRMAGHGGVRAEEAAEPAPEPEPTPPPAPEIDSERDGYSLTLRAAGHGNLLAEEYAEPVAPQPEPDEYVLKIHIEGQGTVIIEEE